MIEAFQPNDINKEIISVKDFQTPPPKSELPDTIATDFEKYKAINDSCITVLESLDNKKNRTPEDSLQYKITEYTLVTNLNKSVQADFAKAKELISSFDQDSSFTTKFVALKKEYNLLSAYIAGNAPTKNTVPTLPYVKLYENLFKINKNVAESIIIPIEKKQKEIILNEIVIQNILLTPTQDDWYLLETHEIWELKTKTPWEEAKKLGFTDNTVIPNLKLRNFLLSPGSN